MNRPKPSALKVLNGSAAHDPQRVNREEPVAPVLTRLPDPPAWLTDPRARRAWAEYGRVAIGLGVLSEADLASLAGTAAAFGEYVAANDNWHERDAAWKRWMSGLGRFGLNPADRSRLHVAPKTKDDGMAALLTPRRKSS